MRYRPEHKQESRQRVLDAAARAIREQGPDGISVAAVMAEAGLTHGGFYAHFASKNALIAATIDYMFDQMSERFDARVEGKPPREALTSYLEYYLSLVHTTTRDSGCPIAALGSDIPRLEAEAREAFVRGMERQHRRIADLLAQMGYEDAEERARSMRSEMFGAVITARLADNGLRDAILEASRRNLLDRFRLEADSAA